MIRAVLLDLDETLIANPDASFAAAFIQLVDDTTAPRLQVNTLRPAFHHMMQCLTAERFTIQNNLQLIYASLADFTHQPKPLIEEAFTDFYAHHYPQLRRYVSPVSGSQALLEMLAQQDVTFALATNPVYPPTAISQRIAWGGLDASRAALITDASVMHFAKPDPAYYAEIIARIGVEPDEALMVGDHPTNDILAAQQVGLYTLLIDPTAPDRLQPLFQLISQVGWRSAWPTAPLSPTAILHALRGNLGALAGLVELAPPHTWDQHPLPNEWSLMQIVTHLWQSESDTQRTRIETIMRHRDGTSLPLLTDVVGDRDLQVPDGLSLLELLEKFIAERHQTLRFLQSLSDHDWQRKAHHTVFGYTTLQEMAAFTAQHDRMHIQQFCQTLGRCEEE
ncbi:HAD-IA family hydrolase [Aggregatilineales bacterium SYSU G02658]